MILRVLRRMGKFSNGARLRALPDEAVVPGDEVFLADLETAAEDIEEAYDEATRTFSNLPPFSQLVRSR